MKVKPMSARARGGQPECDSEAETEASEVGDGSSSSEYEEEASCCPVTNWGKIHEEVPRAPGWIIALAMVSYLCGFAISVTAIVGEFVDPPMIVHIGDFRPPLAVVIAIHGLTHYAIECLLAYAGVVVLYSWKPFHVLQHHVAAIILASVWNLTAVFDNPEYMHLMNTFRPMRLVAISGGLTGINEGLWVISQFVGDPSTRFITGARVLTGMACLIQNIGLSIPCCVLYVSQYLWPRFQSTGSWLALFQIVMNGVVQPLAFHLYLQGGFLRLQYKLLCRVWNDEVKRPSHNRPTLA